MSMKSIFPEYYRPDASSLADAWKTCTFILDANILLSFYRLTAESREDLFATLEAVKNRVWVPYHAALEYQRNKMSVIADQKALIDSITTHIDKSLASLEGGLSGHQMIEPGPVIAEVKQVLDRYKDKLKTLGLSQADVHDPDVIGERIDKLVSGRVGTMPDQATVDAIETEGEARFEREIPPGFKDAKKTETFYGQGLKYQARYGDLHVWKQILQKIQSDKLASVIFLTQDAKEDWWLRVKGKTIGPHPELRAEVTNLGAKSFQIYGLSQFLEFAKKELNQNISSSSIMHAQELDEELVDFFVNEQHFPIVRVRLSPMNDDNRQATIDQICDQIVGFLNVNSIMPVESGDDIIFKVPGRVTDSQASFLINEINGLHGVDRVRPVKTPPEIDTANNYEIEILLHDESRQNEVISKIKKIMSSNRMSCNIITAGDIISIEIEDFYSPGIIIAIKAQLNALHGVRHCVINHRRLNLNNVLS